MTKAEDPEKWSLFQAKCWMLSCWVVAFMAWAWITCEKCLTQKNFRKLFLLWKVLFIKSSMILWEVFVSLSRWYENVDRQFSSSRTHSRFSNFVFFHEQVLPLIIVFSYKGFSNASKLVYMPFSSDYELFVNLLTKVQFIRNLVQRIKTKLSNLINKS